MTNSDNNSSKMSVGKLLLVSNGMVTDSSQKEDESQAITALFVKIFLSFTSYKPHT